MRNSSLGILTPARCYLLLSKTCCQVSSCSGTHTCSNTLAHMNTHTLTRTRTRSHAHTHTLTHKKTSLSTSRLLMNSPTRTNSTTVFYSAILTLHLSSLFIHSYSHSPYQTLSLNLVTIRFSSSLG